jgi:class 3 adenylate cyclase
VTALGDEVNEAARIEASASRGRMLASKNPIERLDPTDARLLAINADRLTYTRFAELSAVRRER